METKEAKMDRKDRKQGLTEDRNDFALRVSAMNRQAEELHRIRQHQAAVEARRLRERESNR